MKRLLTGMALALALAAPASAQDKVRIVVGGKSGVYYLPLSVTERLGYFKDADLNAEIIDVAGGSRALQAIVGGSADIGNGNLDHTIQMQAKGQPVIALLQYGRYPGFVLAVMAGKAAGYRSPADLKGMKIGVTAPGSATQFMATTMLVRNGMKASDVSFIATGATSTAIAAARRAEIDAIVSSDPMMTLMESENLVKVIADARTAEGTRAIYGGPYPGGVIYATPAYIESNPKIVQGVVDALVRGLRWIVTHSAEDIARLMPEEYALGNLPIYIRALNASKPSFSPDGSFEPGAIETGHSVLKQFDPAVAAATVDLRKTYNDTFVKKALEKK